MKVVCVAMLFAAGIMAQSQAPAGGVETEWDLRTLLKNLIEGTQKLKPILDQVNPSRWSDTQASQAYMQQWKAAENQIDYLGRTTAMLSKEPERLTLALEAYFRMQSLQKSVLSLIEGVRKYQNPAVGDLLRGALAENELNRDHLTSYLTELAQTKEQEFKIMDQEAQRCRGVLSRQPVPASKPRRKD